MRFQPKQKSKNNGSLSLKNIALRDNYWGVKGVKGVRGVKDDSLASGLLEGY